MTAATLVPVLILSLMAISCTAEPLVTDLQALYQNGQVFIHWREAEGFRGRLTVHASQEPITQQNLDNATVLVENLHWGLAEDWFRNARVHHERGDVVIAKNIEESSGNEVRSEELIVDEEGLLTFKQFTITCVEGNRLVLR